MSSPARKALHHQQEGSSSVSCNGCHGAADPMVQALQHHIHAALETLSAIHAMNPTIFLPLANDITTAGIDASGVVKSIERLQSRITQSKDKEATTPAVVLVTNESQPTTTTTTVPPPVPQQQPSSDPKPVQAVVPTPAPVEVLPSPPPTSSDGVVQTTAAQTPTPTPAPLPSPPPTINYVVKYQDHGANLVAVFTTETFQCRLNFSYPEEDDSYEGTFEIKEGN
eukprot:PhF_6_TR11667/c1_g2_i4/m.18859